MLIIERLKQQETFSIAEKRIAEYILAHLPEIPTIFIQELAEKTFSSHSTIVRLSQKLGYSGFREFKDALAEVVYANIHSVEEVNANFPFHSLDTPADVAKKMADLTIHTVQRAAMQVDSDQLKLVVDVLMAAKRIFLFSRGDTQLRARSFQNKLIKINKFAIQAEEYVDTEWNAVSIEQQDCAFFLSYSGIVQPYTKIMRYLMEKNIPVILLTGNPDSPMVPYATHVLLTIQEEFDFAKIATFSSQTAFEYILNTIYSVMYTRDYEHNLRNLKGNQDLMTHGLLADEE
ncbi:RpiR family transcriptional regulator [Enterococcus florum]|uniref:RpiR family transcriptional regulator n=1 Tax=Enterococcus florum TaxID=2480627 RepID=A0A4P5P8Y7_9ENTE|nr:MurR/RpiR family transcriptional regulator [Enterococcus florum]GCF94340.1 RpiR family transcriptional regulator [Enterococcus florum]